MVNRKIITYLRQGDEEAEKDGDEADDDKGKKVITVVTAESSSSCVSAIIDTGATAEVARRQSLVTAGLAGGEIHPVI